MMNLAEALIQVKQEVFNEMVEGNGRQPAEVVDMVCYALRDVAGVDHEEMYSVIQFYPDYTGG
jgi:hypothetical protein